MYISRTCNGRDRIEFSAIAESSYLMLRAYPWRVENFIFGQCIKTRFRRLRLMYYTHKQWDAFELAHFSLPGYRTVILRVRRDFQILKTISQNIGVGPNRSDDVSA